MLVNIAVLLILAAIVVPFAWLARRAWRSRHAWIKWPGIVLAGLLALLVLLVTGAYAKGLFDVYAPRAVAAVDVTVPQTPERIARGAHIAQVMCAQCHSQDGTLPLSGGKDFFKEAPMPLGSLSFPNITPGGKLRRLTDADIVRIVRTGVEPDGRWTIMGSFPARYLSDDDLQSVIAYLRSAPAVPGDTPPPEYSPLFMILAGLGVLPLSTPSTVQAITAPPRAPNAAYGEYVKNYMDCKGCHGPTLSADGGTFSPRGAANLTQVVPKWSKDDFFQAMRTGVDASGHQINPPMPWQFIGKLDDVELEALYQYLHALTPITRPAN